MKERSARYKPTRAEIIAALKSEIERLQAEGNEPKTLGIYLDALYIYERENDPGFFVELYFRYYKEGIIPFRAAALGALYAFVSAPTKQPFEAMLEGNIEIVISTDRAALARMPAWVVKGIFEGMHQYLTFNSRSLNEAFRIPQGKKGAEKLSLPLGDLNTAEALIYEQFTQILEGKQPSLVAAARSLESLARCQSEIEDKTHGFNERTSLNALRRIRRAFADRDKRRREGLA